MQPGDRNSAVPGGTDASKRARRLSCAWHQFWSPGGNASYWLMQPGDRHLAVPRGTDASKVRCFRHVPGTNFVRHVPGTNFGAPGAMLAIG